MSNLTWASETMLFYGCYRRRFPTPKVSLKNVGHGPIVRDFGGLLIEYPDQPLFPQAPSAVHYRVEECLAAWEEVYS
jgi:hypothetical protein